MSEGRSAAGTLPPPKARADKPGPDPEHDYDHVRRRLQELHAQATSRQAADDWLHEWRAEVRRRTGQELPAPWVFANEDGVIELEWHLGERHFLLAVPNGPCEFAARWPADGYEAETEGVLDPANAGDWLLWVIGARDAHP